MKRLLSLLVVLTFMLVVSPVQAANSDENYEEAVQIVEKANDKIDFLIEVVQFAALFTEDDAPLIAWLQNTAAAITQQGIEDLAELGYEGVCVDIVVEIDGQSVVVDPLEVWNW
jgi:predicted amidohydrolase